MSIIHFFIDFLQNPLAILNGWIEQIGAIWILAPIWLVLFIETGVVIMPFLPGDSLLFAVGTIAGSGNSIPLLPLLLVVWSAPIIGDQSNYWIGHFLGKRILDSGKIKAMTPERIAKTQAMIDKYGPLAVFLGRFFPFIRTFMPFMAGFNHMKYNRFVPFDILGGLTWSSLFTLLGYFFGNVPFVQTHFEWVIVAILLISLLPTIIGVIKAALASRAKKRAAAEAAARGETVAQVEAAETSAAAEDTAADRREEAGLADLAEASEDVDVVVDEAEEREAYRAKHYAD